MSVLLKGDPEQAKHLAPTVDFFLNEECNSFNECTLYPLLAASGKTVLNAEYSGKCPTTASPLTNLNTTLFKVNLDGPRTPCANSQRWWHGTAPPPATDDHEHDGDDDHDDDTRQRRTSTSPQRHRRTSTTTTTSTPTDRRNDGDAGTNRVSSPRR